MGRVVAVGGLRLRQEPHDECEVPRGGLRHRLVVEVFTLRMSGQSRAGMG